jgi:hypothetical protein
MASLDHFTSTHEKAVVMSRLSKHNPPQYLSKRTPGEKSRDNLANYIKSALKEASLCT